MVKRKMTTEEVSFLLDLQALMKAHCIKLSESEHYDHDENYDGSTFHFVGENVYLEIDEELNEQLRRI
jgi:hypothetical protein